MNAKASKMNAADREHLEEPVEDGERGRMTVKHDVTLPGSGPYRRTIRPAASSARTTRRVLGQLGSPLGPRGRRRGFRSGPPPCAAALGRDVAGSTSVP